MKMIYAPPVTLMRDDAIRHGSALMAAVRASVRYRLNNEGHCCTGLVLTYDGIAYGWKNGLRDPHHERPGAIAVDEIGNAWIAEGGNDYDGAQAWRQFAFAEVAA